MKIWAVFTGSIRYEEHGLTGVFSTKELAERIAATYQPSYADDKGAKDCATVLELTIDDPKDIETIGKAPR